MPLSREQFSALRAKGLSTEQIAKFDKQPKPNALESGIGTAIGVGGQALREGYKRMSPLEKGMMNVAGKGLETLKPIGEAYQGVKDMALDNPWSAAHRQILSDKPMAKGNIPIQEIGKSGNLEKVGNIPYSESPRSVARHLESLGIDFALGGGTKGKVEEFNDPANMLTRASKSHQKARDIMREVLQPKPGEPTQAIDKALPELSKTKTYEGLASQMSGANKGNMAQRDYLIASSKKKIGEEYLRPLQDLYSEMSKDPQLAKKSGPISDAIHSEYEYLFSKPDKKIPVWEAEQRKERLQTLTKSILESGGADISDPVVKQAWDKIRKGFKQSVERVEPGVKPYNESYGGLKEAEELASKQGDLAKNQGEHGFFKNLLSHVIRPSKEATAAALAREAFNRESSLASKTGKAAKEYKKATTLRELASKRLNK